MKNSRFRAPLIAAGIVIFMLLLNFVPVNTAVPAVGFFKLWSKNAETELSDGIFFEILNEDKRVLTKTALPVFVGDEFWAPDNRHYRITKVQGYTAYARYLKTENIAWLDEWDDIPAATSIPAQGKDNSPVIGIYHTHSDESYVPSDGKSSIKANGGIFKVGDVLAEKMKSLGMEVYHDKTPHDPHDAGAYHRSRRTAVKLLKKQPAIEFDVHRDAVPEDIYAGEIDGQSVTKIKMVVGRQNQNKQANLEFAKTMKAAMDKTHPGLFQGIFLAKGNYNQDLGPRMMLIEVGSHKNSREEAQKGVALFADAVPKALGVYQSRAGEPFANQIAAPAVNRNKPGSWSAIWWLLGILLIGGAAFLIISTGSVGGGVKKIREFAGSEWGRRKQK